MSPGEFNELAERVLHSVLRGRAHADRDDLGKVAVDITAQFIKARIDYHVERRKNENLTSAEVELIVGKQPIEAMKSLRNRLGINLKQAKKIVDEARRDMDS